LYLLPPPASKGYRFNPLRVPKSGVLPDFGIGVCLRQTPSIRRWRIAMETAASMPPFRRNNTPYLPQSRKSPISNEQ
jgi:hypothetical protein